MIKRVNNEETLYWDELRKELESNNILQLSGFFNREDLKYITDMTSRRAALFQKELLCLEDLSETSIEELKPRMRAKHLFEKMNFVWEKNSKKTFYDHPQGDHLVSLDSSAYKKHHKMFFYMWNIYKKLVPDSPPRSEYRMHLMKYHNNGHFNLHRHDYHPQKYGLILLVSQKGEDYTEGGTKFYIAEKAQFVQTSELENRGELFIFKYDLAHCVEKTVCSPEQAGRLTAIMPWQGN